MSSVYLGYDEGQGRKVAVKVLSDELAKNHDYLTRFYREAQSGAALEHPNIIRSLTAGRDPASGKHYLVLEYVDGENAGELLARFGRLSAGDALHVVRDIARGLEYAHAHHVIHRDIKPDNILLTRSGLAKLADFGLAKVVLGAKPLTSLHRGFGTPYYMPYEQALCAREADGRSDLYALGVTLYHFVTGTVPFAGSNLLEVLERKKEGTYTPAGAVVPGLPPAVDGMLARLLAARPADRYQTASELLVELDRSGLAAAVPSFIDLDQALQDPLVRSRLTAPAQPTLPNLQVAARRKAAAIPSEEPALASADPAPDAPAWGGLRRLWNGLFTP